MHIENEKLAVRAHLRLMILAERNIGPRSEEGSGQRRWDAATNNLYRHIGKKSFKLGEWRKITAHLLKAAGYTYECHDGVWKWRIPESEVRRRRRIKKEEARKRIMEELPPWCCSDEKYIEFCLKQMGV